MGMLAGSLSLAMNGMASAGYLPSVRIGTAVLISPSAADTHYSTNTISTNILGATTRPPAIVELGRALKNDPDLIYEFIRNNIDVTWTHCLQKGALGAEIDKSGTPFDQAMLMVELLHQSNFTAGYQAGTITLIGAQFTALTGISDATAACQMLSSDAFPARINGSTLANCSYGAGIAISYATLSLTMSMGDHQQPL